MEPTSQSLKSGIEFAINVINSVAIEIALSEMDYREKTASVETLKILKQELIDAITSQPSV